MQSLRTYKMRGYLTKAGHEQLSAVMRQQCTLFNAALEERMLAFKHSSRTSITYAAQSRSLTQIRKDFPGHEGAVDRRVQVATLKRLDLAFRRSSDARIQVKPLAFAL